MLIKFNSFDRAEKTVGSAGTVQENLLRQVKEERDNTTQTHSRPQPLTHTNTHRTTHTHALSQLTESFKHFTFKQEIVSTLLEDYYILESTLFIINWAKFLRITH